MKRDIGVLFLVFLTVFGLASCSGLPKTGGGNNGGGTNTTVAVTIISNPATGFPSISPLSVAVGISGVAFNSSTGSAVPMTLTPSVLPADLNRMQSDSAFLGKVSLPAGTYNSATITFTTTTVTLVNASGSTINGSCPNNSICELILPAGQGKVTFSPALTTSGGSALGFSFNLRLNSAFTLTNNVLALDFTRLDAAVPVVLPRAGIPAGSFDLVEDFTGQITAVTASQLTVKNGNGVSLTFGLSNPTINDPQNICNNNFVVSCLKVNQTVSVDASLTTSAALTATQVDLLDATPQDEVEGTLFLTGVQNQFGLVVTNKVVASANATLAATNVGDLFTVTMNNPSFIVDTDEFFNNASFPTSTVTSAFTGSQSLASGQTVMVHVTAATGSAANNNLALTTDQVRLRFTRIYGVLNTVSGSSFTFNTSPQFLSSFQVPPTVDTFVGITSVDGNADVQSLPVGQIASVRALFVLNTPANFYASKVRLLH